MEFKRQNAMQEQILGWLFIISTCYYKCIFIISLTWDVKYLPQIKKNVLHAIASHFSDWIVKLVAFRFPEDFIVPMVSVI